MHVYSGVSTDNTALCFLVLRLHAVLRRQYIVLCGQYLYIPFHIQTPLISKPVETIDICINR